MCGRFALAVTKSTIEKIFGVSLAEELVPRYNICPSQSAPVVVAGGTAGDTQVRFMRWGLVPSWARDPLIGNRLVNARCETVPQKPSFRSSFRRRRALVPASGFYEWRKEGKARQPYYTAPRQSRLFALAGLWDSWELSEGVLETFTILTTTPNPLLKSIHDRMPVIISPVHYQTWFTRGTEPDFYRMVCQPYPDDQMTVYPVSKRVNSPQNDDETLIESLEGTGT